MENDNMVCAKCNSRIGEHEMCVTLSNGRKICEACIFEALSDKHAEARP